jgi:hypothetical protein
MIPASAAAAGKLTAYPPPPKAMAYECATFWPTLSELDPT